MATQPIGQFSLVGAHGLWSALIAVRREYAEATMNIGMNTRVSSRSLDVAIVAQGTQNQQLISVDPGGAEDRHPAGQQLRLCGQDGPVRVVQYRTASAPMVTLQPAVAAAGQPKPGCNVSGSGPGSMLRASIPRCPTTAS